MLKRTKERNQGRRDERERIGKRLETEVCKIRLAWLKGYADRATRDLLQALGVSEEWKRETVARLRQQAATGQLEPLIAYEQAAFVQSLQATE